MGKGFLLLIAALHFMLYTCLEKYFRKSFAIFAHYVLQSENTLELKLPHMVCTCYTALPTHLAELWASIKLRSCFGAFYGSYVGLQREAHVRDAQAEVPFLLWSC